MDERSDWRDHALVYEAATGVAWPTPWMWAGWDWHDGNEDGRQAAPGTAWAAATMAAGKTAGRKASRASQATMGGQGGKGQGGSEGSRVGAVDLSTAAKEAAAWLTEFDLRHPRESAEEVDLGADEVDEAMARLGL